MDIENKKNKWVASLKKSVLPSLIFVIIMLIMDRFIFSNEQPRSIYFYAVLFLAMLIVYTLSGVIQLQNKEKKYQSYRKK